MAPYWSAGGPAAAAAGPARRASSAGALASAAMQGAVGRKASSAGEAYHRIISSTRNPLYGMTAVGHVGLADSVAGSASDDTSGGSSSASASRHYVDPWDLENFMYLKRHWAAEDGEGEASSTPALESGAQSDFYYVGPSRPAARSSPGLDVDLDVDAYPSMYRPDSVLLEPLALGPASMSVLNAVEEESFFNERFDPSLHQRQHSQHSHRHVRRSHSAAATYLHDALPTSRAGGATPGAPSAYAGRRRSVACAPRYYRTPITGGDSSGEYEAFEDYADELSRRLGAVELERAAAAPQPQSSAASAGPRSKRHSVAVSRPATSHQMPRSRASIAGPAPALPPPARLQASSVRRRHSHCVAWPAPSPAPSPAPRPAPSPAHIYSTRRASFSRGQLLAGLHATHAGRYASDLAYSGGLVYGSTPYGSTPYGSTPYGATPYGTAGSSDDCYVSDASDEYTDGPADGPADGPGNAAVAAAAAAAAAAATGAPRRDAVVDGFTDADLMYAQLASSLYGETPYGYCGSGAAAGLPGYDCSRFQLTNYGHLKIDYSCSWRSLDAYIAHS